MRKTLWAGMLSSSVPAGDGLYEVVTRCPPNRAGWWTRVFGPRRVSDGGGGGYRARCLRLKTVLPPSPETQKYILFRDGNTDDLLTTTGTIEIVLNTCLTVFRVARAGSAEMFCRVNTNIFVIFCFCVFFLEVF